MLKDMSVARLLVLGLAMQAMFFAQGRSLAQDWQPEMAAHSMRIVAPPLPQDPAMDWEVG